MKVGIQLYSIRNTLVKDPLNTMKKVAALGYKYWETAEFYYGDVENNYGLAMPAKEAGKFLEDNGVKIIGAHFYPLDLSTDKYARFLEYHSQIGTPCLGLSSSKFASKDMVLQYCEDYNKAGEMAKQYGMKFYYHNHFQEFQKFDGQYVMDIIVQNTDPALVDFELDTFWSARGGMDPVQLIEKYKNRLNFLHQKDFPKNADEPLNLFIQNVKPDDNIDQEMYNRNHQPQHTVEIGTGILPIQDYIDAGNKVGIQYIILEQDFTTLDEYDSIKLSMENFKKFNGIEWA